MILFLLFNKRTAVIPHSISSVVLLQLQHMDWLWSVLCEFHGVKHTQNPVLFALCLWNFLYKLSHKLTLFSSIVVVPWSPVTGPSPAGVLLKEIFPVAECAVGKAHKNKSIAMMLVWVFQNSQNLQRWKFYSGLGKGEAYGKLSTCLWDEMG